MNNKQFIFPILIIIGASISSFSFMSYSTSTKNNQEISKLEKALPSEMIQILQNPKMVTSIDLQNDSPEEVLNNDQIKQLQAFLLNDKSFHFEAKKLVIFVPSTAISFMKNEEKVGIVISFDARQVEFLFKDFKERLDCDPKIDNLKKNIILIGE